MDMLKKLSIWLGCLTLTACATTAVKQLEGGSEQQQLIARDLIGVLVQIEQLPTSGTTLSLPVDSFAEEGFSAALKYQFEDVGYGIRTIGGTADDLPVTYTVESGEDKAGEKIDTYTLNVGDFGVRRSYQQLAGERLKPASLMNVKGVDARTLRINDDLFAAGGGSIPIASQATAPGTPQDNVQQSAATTIPQDLYRQPTRNFRELEKSNFADLLSSHYIVDEAILLFPNDSVRLGDVNKVRIKEFVEQFDASSDVFSLIGCSNGATTVEGGPKSLALGRGERVRQELLYAGIPEPGILHEGCWSEEYYDEMMPRRGVVISLKRLAK